MPTSIARSRALRLPPASPHPIRFVPTPCQTRFIQTCIVNREACFSVQSLTRFCGISPSTYYRWCKEPGFYAWLTRTWTTHVAAEGWNLLATARQHSNFKFSFWKALADLTFDPKGLALVKAWQESVSTPEFCANFIDPTPDPDPPPDEGGAPCEAPSVAAAPEPETDPDAPLPEGGAPCEAPSVAGQADFDDSAEVLRRLEEARAYRALHFPHRAPPPPPQARRYTGPSLVARHLRRNLARCSGVACPIQQNQRLRPKK